MIICRCTFVLILTLAWATRSLAQDTPASYIERLKIFLLRNLPNNLSCRVRVNILSSPDTDGLHTDNPMPVISVLWKSPSTLLLNVVANDSRGVSEIQKRLSRPVRWINAFSQKADGKLSLIDIFTLALLSNESARVVATEPVNGATCTVLQFSNILLPFPPSIPGNAIKLWLDTNTSQPMRVQLFGQDIVLTATFKYARVSDQAGNRFALPSVIFVEPSLTEPGPSPALPFLLEFVDYEVSSRAAADALHTPEPAP